MKQALKFSVFTLTRAPNYEIVLFAYSRYSTEPHTAAAAVATASLAVEQRPSVKSSCQDTQSLTRKTSPSIHYAC